MKNKTLVTILVALCLLTIWFLVFDVEVSRNFYLFVLQDEFKEDLEAEEKPSLSLTEEGSERYQIHLIMFYESLKPRQFCIAENLVRKNIETKESATPVDVNVWIKDKQTLEKNSIQVLMEELNKMIDESSRNLTLKFKNERFLEIVRDTPLEKLYACQRNCKKLGGFAKQNKSNAARLAILFKYGGLYMDLDFVTFVDPSSVGNTFLQDGVSKESKYIFNNAFMKISGKNRVLLYELMKLFVKDYDGDVWGANGPRLLTKFFNGKGDFCQVKNSNMIQCKHDIELKIWSRRLVYPVSYRSKDKVAFSWKYEEFKRFLYSRVSEDQVSFIHLWHKITKDYEKEAVLEEKTLEERVKSYRDVSIGRLKFELCPLVFQLMKNESIKTGKF
eukprot:snap_masked-scaffold_50-processed-gene-1.31-mRNA-1 protein AED:1.00 eAED:1.00 QI:0/-1/0/0/-1/1/1/0/387